MSTPRPHRDKTSSSKAFRHRDRLARRRHRLAFLPRVEGLEVRRVLSTLVWENPGGGDWDDAANWVNAADASDHHVPTASDDAQINVSGITVTHASTVDD